MTLPRKAAGPAAAEAGADAVAVSVERPASTPADCAFGEGASTGGRFDL